MTLFRIQCDGLDCRSWVSRDSNRRGWIVVVSYPLLDGDDGEDARRHLCRACFRRLKAVLK